MNIIAIFIYFYFISDMWDAAATGDLEKLKRLVEGGYNVNQKDRRQRTPLIWAAEVGHPDCVEYLLKNGAQVDLKDEWGSKSLDRHESVLLQAFNLASLRGHGSTVELLQTAVDKAKGN